MSTSESLAGPQQSLLLEVNQQACALATELARLEGELHLQWQSQQAPGSRMTAAGDARQVAWLMDEWTRIAVPPLTSLLPPGQEYWHTLRGWKSYTVPADPGPVTIEKVNLPDQWVPERTHHQAWYIAQIEHQVDGREYWLTFDAVAHACSVFVNGHEAGSHVGGFTPFQIELTPWLKDDLNTIAIHVQDETAVVDVANRTAISQTGPGRGIYNAHVAGICGGVYLEGRQQVHVRRLRVRSSSRRQTLTTETWLSGDPAPTVVQQSVYEWPDGDEPVLTLPEKTLHGENFTQSTLNWPEAKPWSPDHPNLYVLRTTLKSGNRSETIETRFGFREFWIQEGQFMLNDSPIRLLGDGGVHRALNSIVPGKARDYARKALLFLKRHFHYTSTRLHSFIFPRWTVQAADEAGLLVINQCGLLSSRRDWYRRGGETFLRHTEAQFEAWYWRDVNSPSVVIWDVENELLRNGRDSEIKAWVLQLDEFIRRHDPDAIIQHSGAAWYDKDQQIIHVHMQEQYAKVIESWKARHRHLPLVLGEFWMGGRGETRLPNSFEYTDRQDWHREEGRLYREHMLEMRNHGVNGIMPHRLTCWPLEKDVDALLSQDDAQGDPEPEYRWRWDQSVNQGARGLAPVIVFFWPRQSTAVAGELFTRTIVVCNDRQLAMDLHVTCSYCQQKNSWDVRVAPAGQARLEVTFQAESFTAPMHVSVGGAAGESLEHDALSIHPLPEAALTLEPMRRQVVIVPSMNDALAAMLEKLQVAFTVSKRIPDNAPNTLLLIPPDVAPDALGRDGEAVSQYLAAGGRLLAFAQHEQPAWLPTKLPLFSSLRPSASEFDGAGWPKNNRDLMYSRHLPVFAQSHPVLQHLNADDFKDWGPQDGRISDDVYTRPNALNLHTTGAFRVLLGASRRENASLVELGNHAGTALLCQTHVLSQKHCPAARTLFHNMLRYLDGPAWVMGQDRIGLIGDIDAALLSRLTGVAAESFTCVETTTEVPQVIIAGDRADIDVLQSLARQGATVLVLSCETSGRLPGCEVEQHEDYVYSGTRAGIVDHPLFWGVSSASFLPLQNTPARGAIQRLPDDAQVLMGGHCRGHSPFSNDWSVDIGFYGLETREAAPPIATMWTVGQGAIIATTIEPWDAQAVTHRQLLATLLANAGVPIPTTPGQSATIEVKWTIPLAIDGQLDDWTNDIEDINLSRHSHAVPIPITSTDASAGRIMSDLDLSGIVYFLLDNDHLFAGGIVFERKNAAAVTISLGDHRVTIDLQTGTAEVDGKSVNQGRFAAGLHPADKVIDTHLLNLTKIHGQTNKAEVVADTPGKTFELAIPWTDLGYSQPPSNLNARIELSRPDGALIARPALSEKVKHLTLQMQKEIHVPE